MFRTYQQFRIFKVSIFSHSVFVVIRMRSRWDQQVRNDVTQKEEDGKTEIDGKICLLWNPIKVETCYKEEVLLLHLLQQLYLCVKNA